MFMGSWLGSAVTIKTFPGLATMFLLPRLLLVGPRATLVLVPSGPLDLHHVHLCPCGVVLADDRARLVRKLLHGVPRLTLLHRVDVPSPASSKESKGPFSKRIGFYPPPPPAPKKKQITKNKQKTSAFEVPPPPPVLGYDHLQKQPA